MPTDPAEDPERFRAHAAREMASMFDDVSGRYDLLNRLMTLGQDGEWRRVMWRAVPEEARVVLDLCTGNGVSLPGLMRPGRTVLGVDVSLGMLHRAAEREGRLGWAPRLACADAFRLPLRDRALDAITLAFGVRNLRPRTEAIAEMCRVLRPGGTLVVLEAAAPRPGWFAPFHAFHLRRIVPLLGLLSPDPSAYRYLSSSIFEFGGGLEFERALVARGFLVKEQRSFLLGATRLWVARRVLEPGEIRSGEAAALQIASGEGPIRSEMPQTDPVSEQEWRWWMGAQTVTSATLFGALIYGLYVFLNLSAELPLQPWQRRGLLLLLIGGCVGFGLRTGLLATRWLGPPRRRPGP